MAKPSTTKTKNRIAQRQQQVAEMLSTYATQTEIAEQLGVSVSTISLDYKAIRERWQEQAAVDVRGLAIREGASLDRLEHDLWEQFLATDDPSLRLRTAETILKCKERRAKLFGLDRPDLIQIDISVEQAMEVLEAEIVELETELEAG